MLSYKGSESAVWSLDLAVPVMLAPMADSLVVEPQHHLDRTSAVEDTRVPDWGGQGLVRPRLDYKKNIKRNIIMMFKLREEKDEIMVAYGQ